MKDAPNVYPVKKQEFLSKMAALGIIDSNSFLSAQQKIKQYLFNIGRLQGICDTIAALSFYKRCSVRYNALLAFTTNSSKSFGTSSLGGKCAVSYRIKSGKSKIKGISTQMKDVIKTGVQIVHILSFCGTLLCGVLGVVYEIIGPVKYKQLLSSFGISNGFERTWIWAVVMLILLLSTHFIKAELLSK